MQSLKISEKSFCLGTACAYSMMAAFSVLSAPSYPWSSGAVEYIAPPQSGNELHFNLNGLERDCSVLQMQRATDTIFFLRQMQAHGNAGLDHSSFERKANRLEKLFLRLARHFNAQMSGEKPYDSVETEKILSAFGRLEGEYAMLVAKELPKYASLAAYGKLHNRTQECREEPGPDAILEGHVMHFKECSARIEAINLQQTI